MQRPWLRGSANIAALGAVLWLYGWMATANQNPFVLKGHKDDYFNLLAEAFLAGQVHLKIAPDPNLLRLADPYDPTQNAPYRLHDASLYDGKYYLYNGPTPILTLLVPWMVVNHGVGMPLNLAIFLFCSAAFLWSIALFRRIARVHLPAAAWAQGPMPILLLGLGNFSIVLLRRPMHYETSIACAGCWLFITLYCLCRATELGRGHRWWLLLGSLAGGLTIGSRVNQTFAVLTALTMTFSFVWWQTTAPHQRCGRKAMTLWAAAFGPAGLLVGGLLVYNFVRFGNPLEFGTTYTLSGYSLRHWSPFRLSFLVPNLRLYLLAFPRLALAFPYVGPSAATNIFFPSGHELVEGVVGILPSLPVLWLAPLAFLSPPVQPGRWRWLGLTLFGVGLASLLMLGCFGAATCRYEVDFLPPFTFLAALGALAVWQRAYTRRFAQAVARSLVNLLVVGAILFNVALGLQHMDLLKILNPSLYARLARIGNQPLFLWERLTGVQQGPVRLTVRFPIDRTGQSEPLAVTGAIGRRDAVLAVYPDDRHIQFRLYHAGSGGPTSLPIPIDYRRDHLVDIAMGSLLPGAGSAIYRDLPGEEVEQLRRVFAVKLDGNLVVSSAIDFYEATSRQVDFGIDPAPGGGKFSGVIRSVQYLAAKDLLTSAPGPSVGPLRLEVRFPAPSPGLAQPLVATGRPGAGNVLYVVFEDASHLRLGFDQWEQGTSLSYPISVDFSAPHTIELTAGSLFPAANDPFFAGMSPAERAARRGTLQVRFDGKLILHKLMMDFSGIPFVPPVLGYNSVHSSACAPSFTGLIVDHQRLGREWFALPEPAGAAYGAVSMDVVFPDDRLGRHEPLVVTGRPGHGDFIFVDYLDATHIRLGFDHWGIPGATSDPITVRYGQIYHLVVSMGSLFPPRDDPRMTALPAGDADRLMHTVQVMLHDRVVFNVSRACYDADPAEVYVGKNPIGGSTCDAVFNGTIQASEREPIAPLARPMSP